MNTQNIIRDKDQEKDNISVLSKKSKYSKHSKHSKYSKLSKLSNSFTTEKRFDSEFKNCKEIGQGGFSTVYSVKHILDECEYAIKVIQIKRPKGNLQKELDSVLQEIRILAKYKSEYVVNYCHSWVEVNMKSSINNINKNNMNNSNTSKINQKIIDTNNKKEIENDDSLSSFDLNIVEDDESLVMRWNDNDKSDSENSEKNIEEDDDGINQYYDDKTKDIQGINVIKDIKEISNNKIKDNSPFADIKEINQNIKEAKDIKDLKDLNNHNINNNNNSNSNSNSNIQTQTQMQMQTQTHKDNKVIINNIKYEINQIDYLNIYIQMELCNETLTDYIKKKVNTISLANTNSTNNTNKDSISKIDLNYTIKLFEKIVNSVQWIHERNLIHRDIKPSNIFLTESTIKLGDLGLATNLISNLNLNQTNSKSTTTTKIPSLSSPLNLIHLGSTSISNIQPNNNFNINDFSNILNLNSSQFHTKNIGTIQYAAPEQISSNYYDYKVDIYSLGLVLFEMIYPMTTLMEKTERLEALKSKKILPKSFSVNSEMKTIGELIMNMTNTDSELRMNINEVKNYLNKNLYYDDYNQLKENRTKLTLSPISSGNTRTSRLMSEDIASSYTKNYNKIYEVNMRNNNLGENSNNGVNGGFVWKKR